MTAASGVVASTATDLGYYLLYDMLLFLISLVLDVRMHSPPISPPQLWGALRMTGGILCGHALGNSLNAANFKDNVDVLHPIQGKVLVYSSNKDPANLSIQNMKPGAFIKHIVTSSIQPVLTKVAEKYSPIQSEQIFKSSSSC